MRAILVALGMCFSVAGFAADPVVHDARLSLELVAENPDIVTPIGIALDQKNRLLVIESHTHFRPKGYKGPEADRILLVEDTNKDGKADSFKPFFEGTTHTMAIARGPENWIYVATRMKVFRIRDTNGDDKADEVVDLAVMETKGNYPHNGLTGLTFDNQGRLLFGLGENLGEPYTITAADGGKLSGGGEGGNIYRCNADGSKLERIATGVWNPFSIRVDAQDRIFCVDNDPDGSPPCRLIQVVETGDYGYQFRYGRSGKHPLQAWNGELPGTLPMIAGTGEAPCDILLCEGKLLVTSWGENRIERYTLGVKGATFSATRENIIEGDENFRPVAFAQMPDGTIYFTDWVSRSYNLHSKGKIWRLKYKDGLPPNPTPALNAAEQQAKKALQTRDLDALKSDDLFVRQSAVAGLLKGAGPNDLTFEALKDPRQRLGLLQALRWRDTETDREKWIKAGLADSSPEVRLTAVRWAADLKLKGFGPELNAQLNWAQATPALFKAAMAGIDWIDQGGKLEGARQKEQLLGILNDAKKPAAFRAMALKLLPLSTAELTPAKLKELAGNEDAQLRGEAVRTLAISPSPEKYAALAELAADEKLTPELRADAVIGLAEKSGEHAELLKKLAAGAASPFKAEAERLLTPDSAARKPDEKKPAPEEIEAWAKAVGEGGDAKAGWRSFFHAGGPGCAKCHTYDGRGISVGPDLTRIAAQMGRHRVLESILQPSKEVAPQYVPYIVKTADGQTLTGFPQDRPQASTERFLGQDGKLFSVHMDKMKSRVPQKNSIMPDGLEKALTIGEMRDLLEFLTVGN